MAQTVAEVKKSMTDAFIANASVISIYGLTAGLTFAEQFSAVSLESILFDIIAFFIVLVQQLQDEHKAEVKGIIDNEKVHRLPWYAELAKAFRYGYSLVPDQTYYSDIGLTAAQIEAAQIVKYSAVTKVRKGLRIKVARIVSGDLAPLSGPQLIAFAAYMDRVADAGTNTYPSSDNPDSLKLSLTIYYDALVLDAAGARLDGTASTPVPDAVHAFLLAQPFNGLFIVDLLRTALKAVDGVVIPQIVSVQARYGALPYANVPVEYLPDAGYMRIISPADLTIQYVPHEPI